jgi:hypothetical protein
MHVDDHLTVKILKQQKRAILPGKFLTVAMRTNGSPNIGVILRPKNKQRFQEFGNLT